MRFLREVLDDISRLSPTPSGCHPILELMPRFINSPDRISLVREQSNSLATDSFRTSMLRLMYDKYLLRGKDYIHFA
jgi:hypothetical protein